MIQSPNEDGPPNLEAFFDPQRRAVGTSGPPIILGTGRALLPNHNGDSSAAVLDALAKARDGLQQPEQLAHITLSLDADATSVCNTLRTELRVPWFGRTVNKRESDGTIQILLLRCGAEGGISYAKHSVQRGGDAALALEEAARTAAAEALERLRAPCTFMLFCHTPSGGEAAARRGIDDASPGIVAYGGPAVGEEETGLGWALLGADRVLTAASEETAEIAALHGSLSFLFSAVIKNWAQPAFAEALPYMKPTYVGDAQVDLLTAIRYDDWEKFVWCIEEQGVDVNVKWVNKQNQIPLLAACARARTQMIKYLLDHGADVTHRNDGGFTAAMYTQMLTDYDRNVILDQLKMLEDAGANVMLTPDEVQKLKTATNGRIVE